jgi:hypothetical protein
MSLFRLFHRIERLHMRIAIGWNAEYDDFRKYQGLTVQKLENTFAGGWMRFPSDASLRKCSKLKW